MTGNADPLRFWGKAGGTRHGEPAWHPLPYHSLDVAAVADALLADNPRKLATIAKLLGTDSENARRFVVCLIALHDVGKFSVHFQAKCEEAWEQSVRPLLGEWQNPPPSNHAKDGYTMRELLSLRQLLQPATVDWCPSDLNRLWAAVTGHHGKPANDDGLPTGVVPGITTPCASAALYFCRDVRALFDPLVAIPQPAERNLAVLSWLLCGLTVVADWIGSNRERGWFPYCPPTLSIAEYWENARAKAKIAVKDAGLISSALPPDLTAARILPKIAGTLSPLQQRVSDLELPDGPLLAIIEDVTGSGKTEAALLLAARLLSGGKASGLYFALPTMATANAMHARIEQGYRRLFADDACPSLVLAHGKRMLNEVFSESILGPDVTHEGYDDGGSAACANWIADDRRKAFLAEIGVGTVDQALLGVLPSRHQAIRLWGLSDRVLIIDEAHAYDAYTGRELEALLSFQAALGGSAIVLSATLPRKQQQSLAQAFAAGLGTEPKLETSGDYPLLIIVSASESVAQPIQSRADRARVLPVRRIASAANAVDEVARVAERGGSVAWIRNAVDDAIEATLELKSRGLDPVLLHARFAIGDRLDIEERVRKTLGPEDTTGRRPGFVIVGTQILEQSLDYDVDAMITDLAPIDLMIQRAGRLWRHRRTGRPVENPELIVLSPDPAEVQDRDWYRTLSARAAAVYGHHGIVWRSSKELFAAGAIATPSGVRDLIERVYGSDELDDIPEPLRRASQDAIGNLGAARSFANANLLKLEKGYGGCFNLWTADTSTPTRLGEPVTVFRLGKVEDGAVVPWYPDKSLVRAWSLSEVSIARRKADGVPVPAHAKEIKEAKEQWPEWERDLPLLVLEPDGGTWRGLVTSGADERAVKYERETGLRIAPP